MPSARSQSVSVPVRVVPKSATTPTLKPNITTPLRPATPRPTKKQPAPPRASFPRPSLDAISETNRRRMMWVSVTLFAILLGGGTFFISSQRGSNGSLATFWSRITSTFSGLKWPEKKADAAEREIRSLDAQVFPDFAQ